MARPRTIDDASLLDAALTLMHQHGPAGLTFAAVAQATGLAPATLVQRFGGKDRMTEAALLHAWDQLDASTTKADAETPLTPEGAVALLVGLSGHGDRSRHADGLLLLREDFRNPKLRMRGERWGATLASILGRRLTADPARQAALGRLMANQWQGALIWWGFSREGDLDTFLTVELETFIQMLRQTSTDGQPSQPR